MDKAQCGGQRVELQCPFRNRRNILSHGGCRKGQSTQYNGDLDCSKPHRRFRPTKTNPNPAKTETNARSPPVVEQPLVLVASFCSSVADSSGVAASSGFTASSCLTIPSGLGASTSTFGESRGPSTAMSAKAGAENSRHDTNRAWLNRFI